MKMRFFLSICIAPVCLPLIELQAASLYETVGTEITCSVKWFFLSGNASMRAVERTSLRGRKVILWRGSVDRPGGVLGFIINLLKAYKGATVFDSYIDIETHLPMECIEYRIQRNGKREILDHILYDRENCTMTSLIKDTVLSNVPSDIQDGVSTLIYFLNMADTDKMVVGKRLRANMNVGMKTDKVIVEVTDIEPKQNGVIYTFTSQKLPDVLKYPTVLSVHLLDDGVKKLPVSGVGTIQIPLIGEISIKVTLTTSGI